MAIARTASFNITTSKFIFGLLLASVLTSAGLAGCKESYRPPEVKAPAPDSGVAGSGGDFPVTGINSGTLTVTAVEPATGPFSGGTVAVVRGSGFDETVVIHVGGVAVQPDEVTRDGKNRITIVVPAGMVGPADIEVTQGDTTVVLPAGYLYNALAVKPNKGAAAGGSLVEVFASGATFAADTVVKFDGQACTDLRVNSPQAATCKTPPHATGIVDVIASSPTSKSAPLIAQQSYEFVETADVVNGGLSGGPIAGTLNVTVLSDGAVGNVIPGALVMLGDNPRTARQGLTDKRGSITFADVDLKGPVTVHATAKCFQRVSIVSFDAKDVTLFLSPTLDPACAADGELGPGVRQLASTVSGELIFPGREEFNVNSWDIVPKPKNNEFRVAYIFTTQASLDARRIAPDGTAGELARLVEGNAVIGKRGFIYRINARPAGLAVFALAGLERVDTREFTPYVMGIAHNVVTSPGEEVTNVDLTMDMSLDRELVVNLSGVPAPTADGPDEFLVRAYLDLGGEGLITRDVNGASFDILSRHTSNELFRFMAQPALSGGLRDASYYVLAGYYASNQQRTPYTRQKRAGVLPNAAPLEFGGFLSVPSVVAPALGARIPDDRILRFDLAGPDPDLIIVDVYGGDMLLSWTELLPGHVREVPLPDLSLIKGQTDIAPGFIRWVVTAIKIDDFRFNEFQYTYLSTRYWSHDSANIFFARR
ncbi:MAG: hypothetical protein RL701_3486 [Pseudomonadota bacterium]